MRQHIAPHTGEDRCEVAVIGAGVAGLAAALLLARARRNVVVADDGQPRNAPSAHSRGFLSRDASSPADILRQGRAEAAGYGARFLDARVERLEPDRTLHFPDGSRLRCERVLLATGLKDELPDLPGLAGRWGRDALHCPYCHARESGEGPFAVLGIRPAAIHQSLLLRQWGGDVSLILEDLRPSPEELATLTARGVRAVPGHARGLITDGDDTLLAVRLDTGEVPCRTLFLSPPPRPRDAFTAGLQLERDEAGFPVTDANGRTSLPWLYAAGNAADPRLQALAAAGHGQHVAFAMHNAWVLEEAAAPVTAR